MPSGLFRRGGTHWRRKVWDRSLTAFGTLIASVGASRSFSPRRGVIEIRKVLYPVDLSEPPEAS